MRTLAGDGSSVDTGTPAKLATGAALGGSAALDSSQINEPLNVTAGQSISKADKNRRDRWRRRGESARLLRPLATETPEGHIKPVRPARCGWTLGQEVSIADDRDGKAAGFTGLERCGSIWACPHCSSVIRAGRAEEIEYAVSEHQKTGGDLVFFTGTLRHHQGDILSNTLDFILKAWGNLQRHRRWKKLKKRFEISAYVRAIEVTYGEHGWHPHVHAVFFIDRQLSMDEVSYIRAELFDLWGDLVEKLGGKRPNSKGLDLQKVDKKGKLIARYISKVSGEEKEKTSWSAGAELARGDAKKGREDSLSPFELLDAQPEISESKRSALWREYYLATKGRRAITWSRGLKERYNVEERDDQEILDEMTADDVVWTTAATTFREVRQRDPELLAVALEHAERKRWDKLAEILPLSKTWEDCVESPPPVVARA